MLRILLLVGVGIGIAADAGRADVVVLRNGDRLEGEVVREDDNHVELRQDYGDGKIRYTKSIRKSLIARIEKGDSAASAPASIPASAPAEDALSRRAVTDKASLLKMAMARYQRRDYASAGLDLSSLISRATPAELETFSQEVKTKLSMSLAELAAEAHFLAATATAHGRPVRFSYVTDYEKVALIPRMIAAYQEAIGQDVAPPRERKPARTTRDRGSRRGQDQEGEQQGEAAEQGFGEGQRQASPTSRPVNSIAAWLSKPTEYLEEGPYAAALLGQIHYATSLVTERQRLDPAVKSDATVRDQLNVDKARLGALQRVVAMRASAATSRRRQLTPVERQELIDGFRRQNFEAGSRPAAE